MGLYQHQRNITTLLQICFQYAQGLSVYLIISLFLVKTNPKMMKIYIYFLKHLFKTVLLPMQRNAYSEWMKLSFFGFRISKDGIYPRESKTAANQAFKPPNNITELPSFLGMVKHLSDFIPHLTRLLDPL